MENIANREEAEKCRDLAKQFLVKGEYDKAIRFCEKSQKLYPLAGINELLAKALSRKNGESSSAGAGTNPSSSARSANSSNASAGSATPSSAADSSPRSYTPEQEAGAKKIIALSKRSHYEVLSIPKTATEADIKKAYRKLALKYHPDKNSAPSAEAAFKAISGAMDILSDKQKRETYDSFGHEAAERAESTGQHPGGFRGFHGGGGEIPVEELFNMFFQGGHGGFHRARRGHPFRQPQQREYDDERGGGQQQANFAGLLQLLPVILLMLMAFSNISGGGNQPIYSFHKEGIYKVPRRTNTVGVVKDIPYFVSTSFDHSYPMHSYSFQRVEKSVEEEFRHLLVNKCHNEKSRRETMIKRASWSGSSSEKETAKNTKTPSCEQYEAYFIKGTGSTYYKISQDEF